MKKSDIEETLHGIITIALGAPRGDPDDTHHMVAALAYNALKHYGLDVRELEDPDPDYPDEVSSTAGTLAGDNLYECDFLKSVTWDGHYTDAYRQGKVYKKKRKHS